MGTMIETIPNLGLLRHRHIENWRMVEGTACGLVSSLEYRKEESGQFRADGRRRTLC